MGTDCHCNWQHSRHSYRNSSNEKNQKIVNSRTIGSVLNRIHHNYFYKHSNCNWANAEIPDSCQDLQIQSVNISAKMMVTVSKLSKAKFTRKIWRYIVLELAFWKWPTWLVESTRCAALPKKVCTPVAMTTASISPCLQVEPEYTPSPGPLVTGNDSPVSALYQSGIKRQRSKRRICLHNQNNTSSGVRDEGTKRQEPDLSSKDLLRADGHLQGWCLQAWC